MDARTLLLGTLLPGLVCGALLFGFLALGKSRPRQVWTAAGGFAVALGYAVGMLQVLPWSGWFPWAMRQIAWLFPLIGLWCALEASLPLSDRKRWFVRAALALFTGWLCLRPLLRNLDSGFDEGAGWSSEHTWLWIEIALLALVALVSWRVWERLGGFLRVRASTASATAVALAAAVAQLLGSTASNAQLQGALVAALCACFVAALWRPDRDFAPSLAGVLALLQVALLHDGWRYNALPLASAILIAAAPAFLLLALVFVPDSMAAPKRIAARTAALLVPLGAALLVAWSRMPAPSGY